MESFVPFLSPFGRTARSPFAQGAVLVYVLIVASYLLVSQAVVARSGVAPFALVPVAMPCSDPLALGSEANISSGRSTAQSRGSQA
jgi:hypothetical protein